MPIIGYQRLVPVLIVAGGVKSGWRVRLRERGWGITEEAHHQGNLQEESGNPGGSPEKSQLAGTAIYVFYFRGGGLTSSALGSPAGPLPGAPGNPGNERRSRATTSDASSRAGERD